MEEASRAAQNGRADLSDTILKYVGLPEEPKPHHGLNGAKYEAGHFPASSMVKYYRFVEYPIISDVSETKRISNLFVFERPRCTSLHKELSGDSRRG